MGALLAVVTLVTTLFLAVTPMVQGRAEDRSIGDALRGLPRLQRDLNLSYPTAPLDAGDPTAAIQNGPPDPFASVDATLRESLTPAVTRLLGPSSYAVMSPSLVVSARRGTALTEIRQQVVVRMQSDLEAKVRWTGGGLPGTPTDTTTIDVATPDGGQVAFALPIIPVALRDTTARTYGLTIGDVLELRAVRPGAGPLVVRVVGVFSPVDERDPLWDSDSRMLGVAKVPAEQGAVVNEAALLAAPASYGAISDSLHRDPLNPRGYWRSLVLVHEWRYPLAAERLTRADLTPLREALVRLQSDTRTWQSLPEEPIVTTGLGAALRTHDDHVAGARAIVAFAFAGFTALAVLVLLLTALAGLSRGWDPLHLIRARGCSLLSVVGLVVARTSSAAIVAAGLVLATVSLWTRRGPGLPTLFAVLIIVLLPMLAVAATTVLRLRPTRVDQAPSTRRRRAVAELGLVVVAALAVTTARSRGTDIAAGTTDWYAALAPFLVAAAAAVVALRVLTPALRAAAALAARGRGLIAHVGLTRAARSGQVAVIPLVALVVGTALVTMLTAITVDISTLRATAAQRVVGADVRVDTGQVSDQTVPALTSVPGVEGTAVAHVAGGVSMTGPDGSISVQLVAVDPEAYARVVRDGPLAFDPSGLAGADGGSVPIILSGPSATTETRLTVRGTLVPGHVVGVEPRLARVVNGRSVTVALVPLTRLTDVVPLAVPNTVFARTTDPRALVRRWAADPTAYGPLVTDVTSAAVVGEDVAQRALPTLVAGSFGVTAGLSALTTLLAVLLLLAVTRPDRTQLVVRLRTMGMRRGTERALAWVEVLPLVLVAVATGVGVGMVGPSLVIADVDLSPYTGGAARPPLTVGWPTGLLAGGAVLLLVTIALAIDAALARRSALAENLRRGDSA